MYDALANDGCDSAMGYLMCPPLNAVDLNDWLQNSPWGLLQPRRG